MSPLVLLLVGGAVAAVALAKKAAPPAVASDNKLGGTEKPPLGGHMQFALRPTDDADLLRLYYNPNGLLGSLHAAATPAAAFNASIFHDSAYDAVVFRALNLLTASTPENFAKSRAAGAVILLPGTWKPFARPRPKPGTLMPMVPDGPLPAPTGPMTVFIGGAPTKV